ncbi:MAG: hypothetical protein IJJ41_06165 [Clostridia bacterium]|nr:hypothetical protein [Clostridia bacterium]
MVIQMSVETYAFGGIAVVSFFVAIIAFVFNRMGFVGIGPFCLALALVAAGVIGVIACIPKTDKKTKKKKTKTKKQKKGEVQEAQEAE